MTHQDASGGVDTRPSVRGEGVVATGEDAAHVTQHVGRQGERVGEPVPEIGSRREDLVQGAFRGAAGKACVTYIISAARS